MKLPQELIKGKLREHLSQSDIRFVVTTLTQKEAESESLLKLLSDTGMRDAVLDSPTLVKALEKAQGQVPVSRELYFYILLRPALRAEGLQSRQLAAFLAEALVKFPTAPRPGVHTADYVEALRLAKDYDYFVLSVELANRALFLSAIYGDTLYKAKKNYTVAGLNYYENLAKSCYQNALKHQLSNEFAMKPCLEALAESFAKVRAALEKIKPHYLQLVALEAVKK